MGGRLDLNRPTIPRQCPFRLQHRRKQRGARWNEHGHRCRLAAGCAPDSFIFHVLSVAHASRADASELSMNLPRRRFLQLAMSGATLPALARVASAQSYPSRAVLLLVGYAPGGVNDIVARLTGQMVAERLGQQFIIENRPGGWKQPRHRSSRAGKPRWLYRMRGTRRSIRISSLTSSATSHQSRAR